MKYKKIELELPPLGEVVIALDSNKIIVIGYFYLRNNSREFCLIHRITSYGEGIMLFCNEAPIKWAKLPKFKSIKKAPPIGIEVIMSVITNTGRAYMHGVNLKDYPLEKRNEDGKIDSWLEIECFKEDKD